MENIMISKIINFTMYLILLVIFVLTYSGISLAHEGHNINSTDSSEVFEHQKEELKKQYEEAAMQKVEAAREAAKQKAEAVKIDAQNRKNEIKNNCDARSEELKSKIQKLSQAASRYQEKIDTVNVKINDFKTSRQLNVENYDTLYTITQQKSAASQAAIDQVASFDGNIDCDNATDASAKLSAFKEAVNNAKSALSDYRISTKNLIAAVKAVASAEESDGSATNSESGEVN
jgi:hypothetical protein